MGFLGYMVGTYIAFGIPIAVMTSRAGLSWTWSLLVLIPIIGIPISLLVLINKTWQPRSRA